MSAGPAVCGRCVARGGGCCTSEPGIFGPPLTPKDEERIASETGLARGRFVHVRELDPEEQKAWAEDVPSLKHLARSGQIHSLARPDGRCLLLGERGCTLSIDARPLLCRLFPFVVRGKSLSVQPAGDCLAVEEAESVASLSRKLRTTAAELVQLNHKVRRELTPR